MNVIPEYVIAKPVPEFELDSKQCINILKPLYGLCESGDILHKTFDMNHRHDLGMTHLRSDQALYSLMHDGRLLDGLSG